MAEGDPDGASPTLNPVVTTGTMPANGSNPAVVTTDGPFSAPRARNPPPIGPLNPDAAVAPSTVNLPDTGDPNYRPDAQHVIDQAWSPSGLTNNELLGSFQEYFTAAYVDRMEQFEVVLLRDYLKANLSPGFVRKQKGLRARAELKRILAVGLPEEAEEEAIEDNSQPNENPAIDPNSALVAPATSLPDAAENQAHPQANGDTQVNTHQSPPPQLQNQPQENIFQQNHKERQE